MDAAPRVFISYSHADEAWKDRVVSQLGVLAHEGLLSIWEDRQIAAGDAWAAEIETALASCSLALLLISAEFLTSKFILGNEVPRLLQRREAEGVRVIPVILKPCAWTRVAWLKSIQARPKDGKALSGLSEHDADVALSALAEEVDGLCGAGPVPALAKPVAADAVRVDISKLPAGASDFLGREAELQLLDDAWADEGRTQVLELVAPGGVGKTSLVKRWLDRLRADGWRGAQRVYGWSFFSQGSSEDRQASDDNFLSDALRWFGVPHDPALSPWDKGKLLAGAVARNRTLLVLDGVEPLQYPPGPLAGQLRTPGLQALLGQLASAGLPGLCILTTRERIKDVEEYERSDLHSTGAVVRYDLGNLSESDGARLLHRLGAMRASAAAIADDDAELKQASREVRGHALTLSLLGSFLSLAYEGDIRQRDKVGFDDADDAIRGGRAFKVIAAYEKWFEREGEQGARELAALRLLGFFDRPADAGCLAALREAPVIPGLNEALVGISAAHWNVTLNRLTECGLIDAAATNAAMIDAHPLVREYWAKALPERLPEGWREGHRRLYEYLKASVPPWPDGLVGLQPLYQSVAHGCLAGLQQQSCDEVYRDRILRGTGENGFYSIKKLGAFGADLGAVACFFEEPWQGVSPALSEAKQAWLVSVAAFNLRALGRLTEALEPMRTGLDRAVRGEDWINAAIRASNLSELELTLGRVAAAVKDGKQSVKFADRSCDEFHRMGNRATLADALHQQGERESALRYFREAEDMQMHRQPGCPLLSSLQGFSYCDVLLATAERAAWQRQLAPSPWNQEYPGEGSDACHAVERRAEQTLERASAHGLLLDIALDNLTLGRAALIRAILNHTEIPIPHSTLTWAAKGLSAAVDGLRSAGTQHWIPAALFPHAWLQIVRGNPAAARAKLDEAWRVASRGGMRLFMADIHLHRARLFRDKDELAKARSLIEDCGYGRRLPELEDAEAAALSWDKISTVFVAPPPVKEETLPRTLVYISYGHKDKAWRRRLRQILDADPRVRELIWDDTKIRSNADVWREIDAHVPRARVMLMLGSPEYFAPTSGAYAHEIEPALEAHAAGDLVILWIPVRGDDFSGYPVSRIMAATGAGAVPLDTLSASEQDEALLHVYHELVAHLGLAPIVLSPPVSPPTTTTSHPIVPSERTSQPINREKPMLLTSLPEERRGLQKIANCDLADRDMDIVFIHGLGGDSWTTWMADANDISTFWPNWLAEDFPRCGVWTLGYAANGSKWKEESMPLADRGNQILDLLEGEGLGERPLVFITHSMGGIVAKQILRHAESFGVDRWEAIARQTRGIAFIATPHAGAHIANFAELASAVYRTNEHVKELAAHDSRLRELHGAFLKYQRQHQVICRTYCEKREVRPEIPLLGIKLPKGILVVDETSAEPNIPGERAVPLDEDHISICKPTSRGEQLYKGISRFLKDSLRAAANPR